MTTPAPRKKINVLLLESIHRAAEELFVNETYSVERASGALSPPQLAERLQGVDILGIRSKTQVTEEALRNADRLLAIGCFCIGVNQVDLAEANVRGVPVFNAPFSNTRSVAELILAEVVMLARKLGDCVRQLHQGEWQKSASGCREVRGMTLGIVGYGHIGSQVGVLAESFGMRVVFHDIAKKMPWGNNRPVGSLAELLREADFVSLHVPATPETRSMIGAGELRAMKRGAFLLNASRGSVVDLEALADALRAGHVAGSAVDVYPVEPKQNGPGFECPLSDLPNVIMTPHIGGSTEEAQHTIGREVAEALIKFVETGTTTEAVNFPRIELPLIPDTHRLLHIHRNVPGVMSEVARILSEQKANIHAQQLATDDAIGYLISDLDQAVSREVRDAIRVLPTSIRTRILY